MSKRICRYPKRKPGSLLISAVVVGIIAVAVLAQQLSAEKPIKEPPFVPEEFTAATPICSGLYEEEPLREELYWQLGGGKTLTVAAARLEEPQKLLAIPTEELTERQATALAYLLVPADFARCTLNDFAAPDPSLTEEELCRLRDDCFRLADRLGEVLDGSQKVDPRVTLPTSEGKLTYSTLWQYYDAYRTRLIDWAETYCPADELRQLTALHDRVYSALEVEYLSTKNADVRRSRAGQLYEADRILADAAAGTLAVGEATDRISELWLNR